jgi:aminoglycoside 3-N-acetyltransferase I
MPPTGVQVRVLAATDLALMRDLNRLFSRAFEDEEHYASAPPADSYLLTWLSQQHHIALVALQGNHVVGGITAYLLQKSEQARAEVYLYDLAVDATVRRRGIATALIRFLQEVARARGAGVVFVQADITDPAAIALYDKLGTRESVLHFDLWPPQTAA